MFSRFSPLGGPVTILGNSWGGETLGILFSAQTVGKVPTYENCSCFGGRPPLFSGGSIFWRSIFKGGYLPPLGGAEVGTYCRRPLWVQKSVRFQPPRLWIRPRGDFDPLILNFEVPGPFPGLKRPPNMRKFGFWKF